MSTNMTAGSERACVQKKYVDNGVGPLSIYGPTKEKGRSTCPPRNLERQPAYIEDTQLTHSVPVTVRIKSLMRANS